MYDDKLLWEMQSVFNDGVQVQMKMIATQFENLIKMLEDHEKDMIKMANKINELERRLSKYEEG